MKRCSPPFFLFAIFFSLIFGAPPSGAQEVSCTNRGTFDCAKVVRDRLIEKRAELLQDPKRAYAIASEWSKVYYKAYLGLKKQTRSVSDIEKIQDAVKDAINPVEWAKEKSLDALIKRFLPKLAPLMAVLSSAPATAITVFLTPSEIGSDLDELELTNDEVHKALFPILMINARPDWRQQLSTTLQQVKPPGPELRAAP